jgi:hypothetical protein
MSVARVKPTSSNHPTMSHPFRTSRAEQSQTTARADVTSTLPLSAGVDVLLRQKSVCDNQSHHARENQQRCEGLIIGPVELRAADEAG